MPTVVIIIVWIGKLPVNFPLWLKSVETNGDFKFLLFTDQKIKVKIPENIIVEQTTLKELNDLFSDSLGYKVNIKHPYKFCDFKPAYGEIFQKYISQYDFWGNTDLDMVYGELNRFIEGNVFSYKKILNRGHFVLYRNLPEVNTLFRSSAAIDCQSIFESDSYCFFDEWNGIHKIFKEFSIEQFHEEFIADINHKKLKIKCNNIQNFKNQIFVWEEGQLKQFYIKDQQVYSRELMYIHFQKRKLSYPPELDLNSKVIINSKEFKSFKGEITKEIVRKYDISNYNHLFSFYYNKVLEKLHVKERKVSFDTSLFK